MIQGRKDHTFHNAVIIGGSFGGLAVAHRLLSKIFPTLSSDRSYKITIISPNTQFFWNVGAPRLIVNPDKLAQEKLFLDMQPGFEKYGSQYEHVKAYATSIDPSNQVISFAIVPDGTTSGTLHYDSLILASGTTFKDPVWSLQFGEEVTKQALKEYHAKLPAAKGIVVAGGGATGVETAGELGSLYGKIKDITLVTSSSRLLPRLRDPRLAADAEAMLQKLGVKIVYNTRCQATKVNDGHTVLRMSNGSDYKVDVFIDATGELPNNKFIPKEWLNEDGFLKSHVSTLRADLPGIKNVYVIGSIGSYSDGSVPSVLFAYKALCESIRIDLAGESDTSSRKLLYQPLKADMQIIPVGPGQGVATTFGWKWPSWLVWLYKARNFNVSYAEGFVTGKTL